MRVEKASGELEAYDPQKVMQALRRAGCSQKEAEDIEETVREQITDGISTKKLYKLVFAELRDRHEGIACKYSVREAIANLNPRMQEFERYVAKLFAALGYDITAQGDKLQGKCIEHEIDVLVQKNGSHIIECKHHYNVHSYTGMDVPMRQFARRIDINEGAESPSIAKAWTVTNTKVSRHAIDFSACRNLGLLSWEYPEGEALRDLISKTDLYPVTVCTLPQETRTELSNQNILTLQDVLSADLSETALAEEERRTLTARAEEILD